MTTHRAVAGIRLHGGEPALLAASALYGVSTAVSVVALRQVRPADLLALELLGGAAVLLAAAVSTGRLRRRAALRQALAGALAPGLAYLFGDLGLAHTSASSGSLLLAAEPLLSVLLAVAVLHERLRRRAAAALVVGLAGSAVVAFGAGAGDTRGDTALGNLLVLAASAVAAVYLIAARRLSDDSDGLNASAWQATGGALTTAPFMVLSWAHGGSRLDTAEPAAWAACAAVLLSGALAAVAFNRGIGGVPATRAAQLANLTPVVGTLTAVVVLGDRPSALQLAGGAVILASLALLLRDAASTDTDINEKGLPP